MDPTAWDRATVEQRQGTAEAFLLLLLCLLCIVLMLSHGFVRHHSTWRNDP